MPSVEEVGAEAVTRLPEIRLREVRRDDLSTLFEYQTDPDANRMAAFTAEDPSNREGFMAHWDRILSDDAIIKRVILADGQVAGSILSFQQFGQPSVSYWLGKEYWGHGIATQALSLFLAHVSVRPLYARAARDNIASRRVLEKCGFTIRGEDRGFAQARGEEIDEYVFELRAEDRLSANMLHHLSLGVADLARAGAFYDAALAALGYVRVWEDVRGVGYGIAGGGDRLALKSHPGETSAPGAGFHVAFAAPSREAVVRFHAAALRQGGRDEGAPRLWPEYGDDYFAAFVLDLDGYRIEAVCKSQADGT